MIRLIVIDLDKTLLDNNGYITLYTKDIIKKSRMLGIRIVIATARSKCAAEYAIGDLDVDASIYNNGALVIVGSREIEYPIEQTIANQILLKLSDDKSVQTIKVTTNQDEYSSLNSFKKHGVTYKYWDFNFPLKHNIYKIMIDTHQEFIPNIYSSRFNCTIQRVRQGNTLIITSKEADKIAALRHVAHDLNIPIGDTLAFGDDINDKLMLEFCGVGVAMKNASSEIKKIADFLCDSNQDDGVAKWIDKIILSYSDDYLA